jgi:hypothetical protein
MVAPAVGDAGQKGVEGMPWQEFERSPKSRKSRRDVPVISLGKDRRIGINRHAWEVLDFAPRVVLFWNGDDRTVGIRKLSPEESGGLAVSTTKSGFQLISGTAFLRRFDIDVSQTRRYIARFKDGALVASID